MSHASKRLRRVAVVVTAVGTLVAVPSADGTATATAAPPYATGTAAVTEADPPSPSASGDEVRKLTAAMERKLDATVQRVMRETKVPGGIVGIWMPEQGRYVNSFGVADKTSRRPMFPDLNMRIGSETKTFTVTALLELVDKGAASLDDPIGKYISDVPNGDKITLRELAGMRSGLFNYTQDDDFFKAFTSDPQRPFTPQQLLDYAFKHPVLFPPGEKFDYCNTNLILLGLVIEQVSGQHLGDYLQHNVIDPVGLKDTLFPVANEFPTPHSQGYTNQTATGKVEDAADWNPSWGWAAGAMISDLEELRVRARTVATGELPNGDFLISPATQKQRLTMSPTTIPGAGYGLGIFNVRGWIGHNGSLPGYESLTVYLPSAETTLVVLLNTDIDYKGAEPSTVFGEAITKLISPAHVFTLPAEPAAR
ncbi:serine hydrolase domain-containing protein [Streptomyces sp. NPDC002619]|uniref:serine hydrolase domain-containing protein n=1 Tax=Streptomyces sp. NPDC002619 TaxID=3364655 RepID=UPI00369BA6B1